jgi:hypothetical protein
VYRRGAKRSLTDLDAGPFDQLNELAADYARERAAELVGMKWKDGELVPNPKAKWAITETTRENIRAAVHRAVDDGMQPDQLRQEIEDLADFSRERATVVADTELAKAQTEGALTGWKQSGVVKGKKWILASEHGGPDECDENAAAGEIAVDEAFPSGDFTAPAHPRCWCDVVAIVE